MKGDSIVMHPILSKASLREPDTERLNTMLRVALTPLQYETVVAVYLHGHPQKEVAIDRGVSPASVCQLLQRAERRPGQKRLGYKALVAHVKQAHRLRVSEHFKRPVTLRFFHLVKPQLRVELF